MANHSDILDWKNPLDREAWWATSPWGHKESDMTERLTHKDPIQGILYIQTTSFKAHNHPARG